jgi:hypothetical protein
MRQPVEAAKDWEQAEPLSDDPQEKSWVRSRYALARGEYARAVSLAEELAKAQEVTPEYLCRCACVHALTAATSKDAAPAKDYAARAVALLRDAIAKDYKDLPDLQADPDLDVLRGRDDFRKLIAELAAKK